MWFSIVSAVLLSIVAAVITERIVEPGLGKYEGAVPAGSGEAMSAEESRGLRRALYATLAILAVVLLITLPPGAPLRNPETGAIVGNSPFMDSLIIVIMLMFLASGAADGSAVGTIKSMNDAIAAITKTFAGLSGLLFLFLVISQFLAYFNYTNMATVAAVSLGDLLESANIGAIPLLVGFVLMTTVVDVILGGAIPKWAIFAPIFVPLFMRLGISPEVTLAAYRVGDSPVNPVTPLLAYFALIVVTAQKYRKDAGVGTIIAMMLPYTGLIWLVWTVLLVLWYVLGIPLGVGTGSPRGCSGGTKSNLPRCSGGAVRWDEGPPGEGSGGVSCSGRRSGCCWESPSAPSSSSPCSLRSRRSPGTPAGAPAGPTSGGGAGAGAARRLSRSTTSSSSPASAIPRRSGTTRKRPSSCAACESACRGWR